METEGVPHYENMNFEATSENAHGGSPSIFETVEVRDSSQYNGLNYRDAGVNSPRRPSALYETFGAREAQETMDKEKMKYCCGPKKTWKATKSHLKTGLLFFSTLLAITSMSITIMAQVKMIEIQKLQEDIFLMLTDGFNETNSTTPVNVLGTKCFEQTCERCVDALPSRNALSCACGWTVFQRRMDGSISDFHERVWEEYAEGFGCLNGEFWLGLRKLHTLTLKRRCRLRVELLGWDNDSAYAEYRHSFETNNQNNWFAQSNKIPKVFPTTPINFQSSNVRSIHLQYLEKSNLMLIISYLNFLWKRFHDYRSAESVSRKNFVFQQSRKGSLLSSVNASKIHFSIANEANQFSITVGGYSGTGGDSLTTCTKESIFNVNGSAFSTIDKNNAWDTSERTSLNDNGGWWSNGCTLAAPNAEYGETVTGCGIRWPSWQAGATMKAIQLAIRCA